jgi:nitroimidazol reductase NimA-like FMN-containing flavoprotein (pyridoxamine 5'-phosphate oxidase superfamily)
MKIRNAHSKYGKPLTEQETTYFLTNGRLNIHLGTLDEKGEPNIHPAWYYFAPSKDRLYVGTCKNSKIARNLRKIGTVFFCIDDPNPPYKGVRGKGKVVIHEDINHNIPIAEKIMTRYVESLENPMAKWVLDETKKGSAIILEIIPSYYSTWDYGKAR